MTIPNWILVIALLHLLSCIVFALMYGININQGDLFIHTNIEENYDDYEIDFDYENPTEVPTTENSTDNNEWEISTISDDTQEDAHFRFGLLIGLIVVALFWEIILPLYSINKRIQSYCFSRKYLKAGFFFENVEYYFFYPLNQVQ